LETDLYTFTGGADGCRPSGSLITDSEGNLYGTTQFGGKNSVGTVFKLDPSGHETILHNFGGTGFIPTSGLARDSNGNLYGTTLYGGPYTDGTVYKLDANGYGTNPPHLYRRRGRRSTAGRGHSRSRW
jgi:uncharacterized repeat protein (TIGR03803 family)